ncbi:MAG: urease accessory protein UreD [Pararhodobacter sp.]|nr:urease accessory protein UreD [Pararhodobacter sp.]
MHAAAITTGHQRTRGDAFVGFGLRSGKAKLRDLRQQGAAKAIILPGPEVVFLNTAGGLTGGDKLRYGLDLSDGVRAVATTQTAERIYRANEGVARIDLRFEVGAGGHLDWLPQETILFDGSAAERRSTISLGMGASCLSLEAVILGRAAMGETVTRTHFRDTRQILRKSRPVFLEPLLLDDERLGAGAAVLDGARAIASLVLVGQGSEGALAPARAALNEPGVQGGASAFDGKLVVRLMAGDGWPLRRQIARLLAVLRRAPLPRVWQMQEVAA